MATLSPDFGDFLPGWIARQRWYRGTGTAPHLREVASIRWEDPLGEVGLEDHILVDDSGPEPVVYQVPLSYRAEPVDFMAAALVATAEHSDLGTRYVYDATHDPVFAQVLLQHMYDQHDVPSARARRIVAGGTAPALRSARVLSGEQSNTSIIVEAHGETRPVIMKVFRVLQAGENPDVTVPTAVAVRGNRTVPGPIGYVEGRWPADGAEVLGHLAFAQEFLPDTQDAWRTALEAARQDDDFTEQARSLGTTIASLHSSLREAFETREPDLASRVTIVDQMRARADAAFAEVPELAPYREAVEAIHQDLDHLELPALQRVHGDFHLGQALHVPGRGWVVVDFEGEPLRPLDERTAPDLALRDVAGMLRSFDYAAASVAQEGAGEREDWASSARAAFLEGYAEASGEDLDADERRQLLEALELDKALYEVVYEARNRPDWMPIPVGAVQRLLGAAAGRHESAGPFLPSADDERPGRHRADGSGQAHSRSAPRESAGGHDEPTAQDFGVGGAAAPTRTWGLADLDPAVHGPSSQDPEDESDDLSAVYTGAGHGVVAQPEPGTDEHADDAAPERPRTATVPSAAHPPASGGTAHEPIPAPVEMLAPLAPLPPVAADPGEKAPGPEADEPPTARVYPAASGWVPARDAHGVPLDPQAQREQAWDQALQSPAIVSGTVLGAGDGADGGAVRGGTGAAVHTRVPLSPPQHPSPPHTRPLDLDDATDVVYGMHRSPHDILGAHAHEGHVTIRTVRTQADAVSVLLPGGREVEMTHETGGIWVAVVQQAEVPDYRLAVQEGGERTVVDEAYRHSPLLGDTDLHLIGEGRHEELWRVLGSHVRTTRDALGEITGTHFAVWAPNALAVHVIGDFNGWDGTNHALRVHEPVGVWEIFIPGVLAGAHYKYDITGPDGTRRTKADPMARATEVPPFNNTVVTQSSHRWGDQAWMARRQAEDIHLGPMSIYEVHLASWRQGLGYEELAEQLVSYVSQMGFTHVEFMPVMQHPYGGSWGYHVTGYFAADSRFGHEDGLRHLIDRLHQAGIGVILDWVPGHFATDPWALARFDGTPIYEHPDPRKGWHSEWGSYIFDFGRPEVRNFLVANATYWMEEFHADGLRVDGVASMLYLDYSREAGQWIPNRHGGRENLEAVALLQETNATAYRRNPGVVMIAEESTSWPGVTAPTDEGGLGFGFKWNMGWMHDTLDYLGQNPYQRAHHHHALTFSLVYAFSESYILPISHDEVVHGKGSLVRKMFGDTWQKFATTRAFLAYQWSHPGKQLLFMGSEFAQGKEWADAGSLSWELLGQSEHAGVQRLVHDLNALYAELPALWAIDHHEDGFSWLDANDTQRNIYSYLRWGNEGPDGLRPVVAVVVNFSGMQHHGVHVGLPYGGRWREVLNTDAEHYGGSGQGNMGSIQAYDNPHQRQPWSALVTVPPMGAVWLVPDPLTPEEEAAAAAVRAEEVATRQELEVGQPVEDSVSTTEDAETTAEVPETTAVLPEDDTATGVGSDTLTDTTSTAAADPTAEPDETKD
ncbi:1,4-alpha-glucan branching protein GlgB [Ornithinimicrobium sp. LYQ103]|uniref:1,4-alpha-glucan branching protein GlgB n=1 Tax=Ornithinimicrobium sp. LYQ103 TaxID=3378796 RepID=UPI003853B745